jgi:hypothetical protein
MIPRLEQLEDRCCPSTITEGAWNSQFNQACTNIINTEFNVMEHVNVSVQTPWFNFFLNFNLSVLNGAAQAQTLFVGGTADSDQVNSSFDQSFNNNPLFFNFSSMEGLFIGTPALFI